MWWVSFGYCSGAAFFVRLRMLRSTQPDAVRHSMFHLICCIMAIVNSLAIGKSVKSAGNLTYKTVRGRTIASQRITSNKSNTPLQQAQRSLFTQVSQSVQFLSPWIDKCYEKSKYGSARNNFMKTNARFTLGGILGEIKEGIAKPIEGMLQSYSLGAGQSVRDLAFFSKGTLPCIVNESTKVTASFEKLEVTYTNLLTCSALSFDFLQGVALSDLRIVLVGFGVGDASFKVADCDISESGAVTLPREFELDGNITLTVSEGVVSSMVVSFSSSLDLIQAIPVVGGKVPTVRSMFMITE